MEFKYINDKNKTPQSKSNLFRRSNGGNLFELSHNISTPPSRFSKIVNPFEYHLIDSLHLPTFSPSVFSTHSTPKTDTQFKWTIDEISSLKPADIDEGTISQQISNEDPHVESLVQKKIDEFFNEKVIVPSPMIDIVRVPLITDSPVNVFLPREPKEYCEGSTQTMLSLPPVLPAHIEEVLKPYFQPIEKKTDFIMEMKNSSLYRNLFSNCENVESPADDQDVAQSPPLPEKDFSPMKAPVSLSRNHSLSFEIADLQDCSLSPIGGSNRSRKESRSAVRLDFSAKMSFDASMIVPDIGNDITNHSELFELSQRHPQPLDQISDSSVNWDMENAHVSLISPSTSPGGNKMDISHLHTPHSKLFTSQRKRLSHSFDMEEDAFRKENEMANENVKQGRKLFRNDCTDAGYHTESVTFCDESRSSLYMFASTPTKTQKNQKELQ